MAEEHKDEKKKSPQPAKPTIDDLSEEQIIEREVEPLRQAFRLCLGHLFTGPKSNGKQKPLEGAEVGVYRGRSLAVLLEAAAEAGVDFNWTAFDTFEGMPTLSATDLELAPENAPYLRRRAFSDSTFREVEAFLAPFPRAERIEFVHGDICQTLAAQPDKTFAFVNISVKSYSAHLAALDYFYPRMAKGGVIFLDDFTNRQFPMAEAAIREFMLDKPELVMTLISGEGSANFRRAFVVKE